MRRTIRSKPLETPMTRRLLKRMKPETQRPSMMLLLSFTVKKQRVLTQLLKVLNKRLERPKNNSTMPMLSSHKLKKLSTTTKMDQLFSTLFKPSRMLKIRLIPRKLI
jgi:hypothetical protein